MKNKTNKILAFILVLILAFSGLVTALAADGDSYTGDTVTILKEDGNENGMFVPQDGTTAQIDGEDVLIHFVAKPDTSYTILHIGSIADENLSEGFVLTDGAYEISLKKTKCGTQVAVAFVSRQKARSP